MSLQPVATTILAYYLFGEDVQTAQCVGASSIIAGMFVTVIAQNEGSVSGMTGGMVGGLSSVQTVVCDGCIWLTRFGWNDEKKDEGGGDKVVYQQLKALVT